MGLAGCPPAWMNTRTNLRHASGAPEEHRGKQAGQARARPMSHRALCHAAACIMEAMSPSARLDEMVKNLRGMLPDVTARYQVREMALFGSFVREGTSPGSDLDILVSFSEPPSILQFLELQAHLSDRLGVKVDLVMRDALKPRIGERILRELVPL